MRVLLLVAFVVAAVGCEPEIGGLCDPDAKKVRDRITVQQGTNNLVQDVSLDNCSQGFCLSTDGSRPYCTKKCQADIECTEAGAGFACQAVINFGPLACSDFEDPTQPQPGTTPSGTSCEDNTACTVANEICLPNAGNKICGIPGRDCVTGDGGAPSPNPNKFCAASRDVITARDRQYGR